MRLPRVRFTVRRLMIVVAVLAAVLGVGVWSVKMWRRSERYRQNAYTYNLLGRLMRMIDHVSIERANRMSAYYFELSSKYEYAARFPWLPVTPDTPPPDHSDLVLPPPLDGELETCGGRGG